MKAWGAQAVLEKKLRITAGMVGRNHRGTVYVYVYVYVYASLYANVSSWPAELMVS